jgi:hypothetical protein
MWRSRELKMSTPQSDVCEERAKFQNSSQVHLMPGPECQRLERYGACLPAFPPVSKPGVCELMASRSFKNIQPSNACCATLCYSKMTNVRGHVEDIGVEKLNAPNLCATAESDSESIREASGVESQLWHISFSFPVALEYLACDKHGGWVYIPRRLR